MIPQSTSTFYGTETWRQWNEDTFSQGNKHWWCVICVLPSQIGCEGVGPVHPQSLFTLQNLESQHVQTSISLNISQLQLMSWFPIIHPTVLQFCFIFWYNGWDPVSLRLVPAASLQFKKLLPCLQTSILEFSILFITLHRESMPREAVSMKKPQNQQICRSSLSLDLGL